MSNSIIRTFSMHVNVMVQQLVKDVRILELVSSLHFRPNNKMHFTLFRAT